jgi:hypothetical protein
MRKKKRRTLFNDYFCFVCQIENSDAALPSLFAFQNSKYLANISTSEQEINILLRNVDISKVVVVTVLGFRPGDSSVNQLILITHKMYEGLEQGNEVRMVFLDISKAFDKVWHKGLLYKFERLGVRDPLLKWFKTYLTGRKQRVIIDGQSSD